jgi:hypothetical protein
VGVVAEPVQECCGQLGIAEDLYPLAEGEIGCDESRASFVAFGQQVEEEFSAGAVERNKTKFIDKEQIRPRHAAMELSQETLVASFKERAHKFRRSGKGDTEATPRRLHTEADGNVRFSVMAIFP